MEAYLSRKIKALSFFCMIMVVFLHANNLTIKMGSEVNHIQAGYNSFIQNFLTEGVTRIAVPIFFIISGYLFFLSIKSGHIGEFLPKYQKRLKSLVLPYLLWSVFGILFFFFLQSFPLSQPFFTRELIRDYTWTEFIIGIFYSPIPYQLWFIRDLFILVIASPVLYWLLRYFKGSILLVFYCTWLFNLDYYIFSNEALLFFSVGAYFAIEKIKLQHKILKKQALLISSVWLILVFCKTVLLHIGIEKQLFILLFHKTSILVGIVAIGSLYDFLSKSSLFRRKIDGLFQFTFFLFLCHEPMLSIFKKGLYFLLGESEFSSFLIFFTAPSLTIMAVILIGFILKRRTPSFYALLTGGR